VKSTKAVCKSQGTRKIPCSNRIFLAPDGKTQGTRKIPCSNRIFLAPDGKTQGTRKIPCSNRIFLAPDGKTQGTRKIPCSNRIFLAPMEEVNDVAFRLLCKKAGAGLTYTGMINPLTQKEIFLEDKPALQLFCTSEKGVKEFIKKYDDQVSFWDFNLGCPAKTAKKHGFGSFLIGNLKIIEKILKTIRESTNKPVTVKLRKSKNTLKILRIAEKYCDALCIHPRTQAQGYGGNADLEFAEKLKSQTKLPVIYSGDVNEENYQTLLKKFDFVMIGRKAIGNPNIFSTIWGKKTTFSFNDYLKETEKYNLPFRQIKFQAMCFTKGKDDAAKLRLTISKIKNLKELKMFVNKNF
jgi:tRNA-dihydrouridine synthase B